MHDTQTPTAGEMLDEVAGIVTGVGLMLLPALILAVPGLVLLLPLVLLALPVVAIGVLLAPVYLVATLVRARRAPEHPH